MAGQTATATDTDPDDISEYQIDALREYLSIGVGKAASTLNIMLGMHVDLDVPRISVLKFGDPELESEFGGEKFATVSLRFDGNIKGTASVIFDQRSASAIFKILMPGSPTNTAEMDEICESTLVEVGNIIINSVMGSISNSFNFYLEYEVPRYSDSSVAQIRALNDEKENKGIDALVIHFGDAFRMGADSNIQGKIVLFCVLDDLKQVLDQWKEPGYAN